ncbi:MAG: hypothetical protein R6V77_00475, partial [Candidatus Cloacimonadaceae bacterium]
GDGTYAVFSPLYVPTLQHLDRYECHVGLGYTTFITEIMGIRTQMRVFVPPGKSLVIQQVTVTILADEAQFLDVIPVAEYTHPDALKQLTNADWVPQTMGSYLDDLPESQKEHYAKMGYKPYMANGGKIKWLSFDQHVYEIIRYDDRKRVAPLKNLRTSLKKQYRAVRKVFRAMLRNWFLIVLAAMIILIFIYHQVLLELF